VETGIHGSGRRLFLGKRLVFVEGENAERNRSRSTSERRVVTRGLCSLRRSGEER